MLNFIINLNYTKLESINIFFPSRCVIYLFLTLLFIGSLVIYATTVAGSSKNVEETQTISDKFLYKQEDSYTTVDIACVQSLTNKKKVPYLAIYDTLGPDSVKLKSLYSKNVYTIVDVAEAGIGWRGLFNEHATSDFYKGKSFKETLYTQNGVTKRGVWAPRYDKMKAVEMGYKVTSDGQPIVNSTDGRHVLVFYKST